MGTRVADLFASLGFKIDEAALKKADAAIKGLHRSVLNLATGFGIAIGVRGLARMAEEATHTGTHVLAMSKQFGISTDAVQQLGYLAQQSGSNMNELGVAASQLERNLRLFSEGKGPKEVQRTFAEFGITQAMAAKAMRSPDGLMQILPVMADHAKKLGNNMDVASGLTVIGGRRARGFAADMAQGGDRMREMFAHLRANGGIISAEELEELKKADNTLQDVKVSLHAVVMRTVAAFGPQLIAMLQSASEWIRDNADTLQNILGGALKTVAALFKILGTIVSGFVSIFGDHAGQALSLLLILMRFGALAPIFSAVTTAIKGMNLALTASPLFLILAAVTVALVLIIKYWDQIKSAILAAGAAITRAFERAYDAVVDGLSSAWQWVKDTATEVGEWIYDKITWPFRKVKEFVGSVIGAVGDAAGAVGNFITGRGGGSSGSGRAISTDALDRATGPVSVPASAGGGSGSANNTTVHQTNHTNVTITAGNAKEAREKFDADSLDRANRHAAAALGAEVQ